MTTTVRTLIAALSELPPDAEVVMSKDEEGNRFSPYFAFSVGYYEPLNTWSGEFESHDTARGGNINAVCLWPVT